jgi:hypothetical protein
MVATRARIAVYLAVVALGGCMRGPNPLPAPAVPVSDELTKRIDSYLALHRSVEATLSPRKETEDPVRLVERRKALAAGIRAARPDARQGTIFTPAVEADIRRIIRADIRAREPDDQAAMRKEVPRLPFAVNDEYPESAPLATVPAMLLAHLRRLPEDLEYRFFGRHLILLDVDANLIVDYIPDALPAASS